MNFIKQILKVVAILSLVATGAYAADQVAEGDIVKIGDTNFRMITCLHRMHAQPQECRYSGCERSNMVMTLKSPELCPDETYPVACLCEVKTIVIEDPEIPGEIR